MPLKVTGMSQISRQLPKGIGGFLTMVSVFDYRHICHFTIPHKYQNLDNIH